MRGRLSGQQRVVLANGSLRHGLGRLGAGPSGPQLLATGGAVGTSVAASAGAFSSLGVWAGPVGAGIGAVVGVIAGLWAAHAARAKGAKTENQAVNSALQAFDASLQYLFQQANSGQVTGTQAAGIAQQILGNYWAGMAPYMSGPGRADTSGGGANCGSSTLNPAGPCMGTPGGHKCDKSCTAGCCVGCQDLYPTILQAIQVFNSPTGGTVQACGVAGSSYGVSARSGYSLTYTPPAPTSAAGIANALTNPAAAAATTAAISSDLSTPVAGIPLWVLLAGGVAAYFALRPRA